VIFSALLFISFLLLFPQGNRNYRQATCQTARYCAGDNSTIKLRSFNQDPAINRRYGKFAAPELAMLTKIDGPHPLTALDKRLFDLDDGARFIMKHPPEIRHETCPTPGGVVTKRCLSDNFRIGCDKGRNFKMTDRRFGRCGPNKIFFSQRRSL
jgi:hypothetical protein